MRKDSAQQVSRFENNIGQGAEKAKEDLTTWVEDGVSQVSEGFEKLTGEAKDAVTSAAVTAKKNVGHGLSHYNAKVQKFVDKVPGGFGKKASKYPWVTISIALVVGFLLGNLLKPTHQIFG